MSRHIPSLIATVLGLSLAALTPANAADGKAWTDCKSSSAERIEAGCSAIITADATKTSSRVEALIRRSKMRTADANLDGAAADLDRAITLDPSNGAAYLERGRVHELQGRFAKATADYEKAAKVFATLTPGVEPDAKAEPAAVMPPPVRPKSHSRASDPKATPAKRRVRHKPKRRVKRKAQRKAHRRTAQRKTHHRTSQRGPKENIRSKVDKQINCTIAGGFDC